MLEVLTENQQDIILKKEEENLKSTKESDRVKTQPSTLSYWTEWKDRHFFNNFILLHFDLSVLQQVTSYTTNCLHIFPLLNVISSCLKMKRKIPFFHVDYCFILYNFVENVGSYTSHTAYDNHTIFSIKYFTFACFHY